MPLHARADTLVTPFRRVQEVVHPGVSGSSVLCSNLMRADWGNALSDPVSPCEAVCSSKDCSSSQSVCVPAPVRQTVEQCP